MRLYVLGPAFGLPSIDAECIAAVALLRLQCAEGEWRLVPTHHQRRRLPYLIDGEDHIEGFQNIARHFDTTTTNLSDKRRADSTATSSFIASHAQTLLDIALYVSFENYTATRTAFTKILPWHANYTIPPARRAAARARTEHLGISSIDVDDVHEDLSDRQAAGFDTSVGKKEQTFEAETQKRASLLLPRKDTVRSLLQRPQHSAVFKLHALADNFFAPLRDMLSESSGEYLLGTDQPRAVDCLAYGYLSLLLYPPLPQEWLGKIMRVKYPALVQYTEGMHERLNLRTEADEVMFLSHCKNAGEVNGLRKSCRMSLPWDKPEHSGPIDVATAVFHDLASRIPLLGTTKIELLPSTPEKPSVWSKYGPAMLGASATTIGLLGYYAFATGSLTWPQYGEQVHIFGRKRLADYGHLGAALAGMSLLGQQTAASREPLDVYGDVHQESPVNVEVVVERDRVT